jgi:hypothetical protein
MAITTMVIMAGAMVAAGRRVFRHLTRSAKHIKVDAQSCASTIGAYPVFQQQTIAMLGGRNDLECLMSTSTKPAHLKFIAFA